MGITTLSPIRLGKKVFEREPYAGSPRPIILKQPKKSKAKAIKFATATTALLGATLVSTGVGAGVGAVLLSSTIPALAIEFLAPKTFEKVINIPGGTEVLIATAAAGPVGGAVVGAEKGTGFLQEAGLTFGQAAFVTGAGIVGTGAAVLGTKDLLTTSTKELEKKLRKKIKKDLEKEISSSLPGTSQTPTTSPGVVGSIPGSPELTPQTPATQELTKARRKSGKRKRQEAPHQTISQRVNVIVNSNRKFIKNVLYA